MPSLSEMGIFFKDLRAAVTGRSLSGEATFDKTGNPTITAQTPDVNARIFPVVPEGTFDPGLSIQAKGSVRVDDQHVVLGLNTSGDSLDEGLAK